MAYEHLNNPITLPVATTGIPQYRFVAYGATGLTWPTAGGVNVLGVTASTCSSAAAASALGPVAACVAQVGSIVKVASTASSLAAGDLVSCTSRGRVKALAGGDNCLGVITHGSSGTARVLTVAITLAGTT